MTSPTLLDPNKNKLEWEKTDQQITEKYNQQATQDAISPTAGQLSDQPYYDRLNTIRADSANATAGAIAVEEQQKARTAALAQQEFQRQNAAAIARAQADGQAYGQNDPNFGALSNNGYSGDWGGGGAQGVANVLRAAGFPESLVPTFMAIGMAESSWNPSATHSNPNGTIDQGLFQINSVHQGNPWYPTNPMDPLQSAKAAYAIYQSQGLNAWTVYKTGAYQKFMQAAPAIQRVATQQAYNNGNYGPANYSGLAGNAKAAQSFIQSTFGISNIGGFGGGSVSGSDHPKGKALDVMIPDYRSAAGIAKGNSVASWFIQNPAAYGIKYIIWRDRIWQNGVWQPYQHPSGSNDTLQHRDHVHLSFL